jgi:hypothetical protein
MTGARLHCCNVFKHGQCDCAVTLRCTAHLLASCCRPAAWPWCGASLSPHHRQQCVHHAEHESIASSVWTHSSSSSSSSSGQSVRGDMHSMQTCVAKDTHWAVLGGGSCMGS